MSKIDWFIFLVLLTGLIAFGFALRKYVKGVADFLVANRKIRKYLGLSAQTAEGAGLVAIAASAQQGFEHGFSLIWISVILMLISVPLFGIMGFGIKRFRATKCMTIAQFLEERYLSKRLRILIGMVLALSGILNMAIFPRVGSNFLRIFLGFPENINLLGIDVSIAAVLMLVLISFAVFFTFIGGMVTIVVIDFMQAIILVLTLTFVAGFTIVVIGLPKVHHSLFNELGNGAYNPFASGSYGLTWILWIMLLTVFVRLAFAPAVQKLASSESPETARKMDLLAGFFGSGMRAFVLLVGVGALAAFGSAIPMGMDAETYRRSVSALYMRDALPVVMTGFALAAMLFASICTDSSGLLAWSATITNDIISPFRKKPFSPKGHLFAIRLSVIGVAVCILSWGFFYRANESILEYMYMTGTILAGIGIAVMFGLYWKKATAAGAYSAIIVCMLLPLADLIGKQFITNYPFTTQQSGLYAIIGAIVAMIVVSLLTFRRSSSGWMDYGKIMREMDNEEKARKLLRK